MIHDTVAIFLIVLLIILLGSVVFRRMRIPPIVGMIIAGIAVGPYGFGLLERDASFRIFGDVGILYIMFQAAVEIDMFHLKAQWRSGVLFGLLSFTLPMLAGVFGTRYLLGAGWDTSILVATMFAAHTLLTYPVVSKFGLQNTRPVVVAVCGTIVSVMLALFVLAGVVQISATGGYSPKQLLTLLALTAMFLGAVGYFFPIITRVFFHNTTDPVAQYIFILAEVLVAALGARMIGLEGILGAFYAGLVLNNLIPGRSPLMKNIRFVGDAVFIPYFLIGVGMLINVRVVVEGWAVIWSAIIMTLLALTSKWLAAFATQKFLRMSGVDRGLMFGLSGGKAAATIAAVMIGYKYGLLNEDMMNASVVMILFCCLVASVQTERRAKQLRIIKTSRNLDREELEPVEYARQLVGVCNPMTAGELMRLALFMRKRDNTRAATALFVRSNDDSDTLRMGREALDEATSIAEEMDVEAENVERFDLNAVQGICNVAHEKGATEILLGMHRRNSVVDSFYGAMTEHLIQDCTRMVMLSRSFSPVGMITRITVVVPQNAEYETGFHMWVTRLGTLAANIEAKITFLSYATTASLIQAAVEEDNIQADIRYRTVTEWDDFITLTSDIDDGDLLVMISARRGSISHSPDLEQTTAYISRHFQRHNLLVIFPKQW
ncbi:MAG: cation:proton antiporter [Bacteroidales bacterium]|nr:cation:proton antiporter [Bacteroidales bacterium]